MSELTSISTESAIRTLKDLKDDNIIDMNNKSIALPDMQRLENISAKG